MAVGGLEGGKLQELSGRLAKMTSEKAEWMIGEVAKWLPRLILARKAIVKPFLHQELEIFGAKRPAGAKCSNSF